MIYSILKRIQLPPDPVDCPAEMYELITGYVNDAVCQLVQNGVNAQIDSEDLLIVSAVECYVKSQINYDNKAEWYEKQWEKRKLRLMLDPDYTGGASDA
ncbi:MAG: hypothetical protein IKK85_03515 [Clostridia bacterium]|nr:hypothetical protein [Clostridia bacterium]